MGTTIIASKTQTFFNSDVYFLINRSAPNEIKAPIPSITGIINGILTPERSPVDGVLKKSAHTAITMQIIEMIISGVIFLNITVQIYNEIKLLSYRQSRSCNHEHSDLQTSYFNFNS